MSKEACGLTQVEMENGFREWGRRERIKRILLDMDGTICPTGKLFKIFMNQAYDLLSSRNPAVSRGMWKDEIEEINDHSFETYGVNPKRWDHVVDELTTRHSLSHDIGMETKHIFQQIYITPLSWLEGAEEGLEFFRRTGFPIGIVTHAGEAWTGRKYGWLGLDRYVKWDDIFLVDENGHKTTESWKQGIKYFKLMPVNCAAVGDSPRSDINPAWEAGVRHCFLVEDPDQWSVHNQSVDPRVYRIKSLNQIPRAVLECI